MNSIEISEAINQPLTIINRIISSSSSNHQPYQISKTFQETFSTQSSISQVKFLSSSFISSKPQNQLYPNPDSIPTHTYQQIPSITNPSTPPHRIPNETLVRFRCMVQDTGLGTELYSPHQQNLYRETRSDDPALLLPSLDPSQLSERELLYAVEIPGESDWVRDRFDPISDHRALEYSLNTLNLGSDDQDRISSSSPHSNLSKLDSTRHKFPILGQPHLAALLKLYPTERGENDQIKTSTAIEVIGILAWTDFSPGQDHLDHHSQPTTQPDTERAPVDQIPCIHVLFHRPVPSISLNRILTNPDQQTLRQRLVSYIARQAFGGDDLAAQYLLCAMTARIHTRTHGLALGAMPLNLIYKQDASSSQPTALAKLLSTLLPRTITIPLTVQSLNSRALFPISQEDSLHAGSLQLAPSTMVLLDSSKMDEGQLNSMGTRNVEVLGRLIEEGKLLYSFPYSRFEFDHELPMVIISEGSKTFLKGFWHLKVVEPTNRLDEVKVEEEEPSPEELDRWRWAIEEMRRNEISIPESLASEIQETFVNLRKGAKSVTEAESAMSQSDLSQRLELARLIGLQSGMKEVRLEDWQLSGKLEKLRKVRNGGV